MEGNSFMNDYLRIKKYYINHDQLVSYRFLCNSKECVMSNECCCKIFDVEISPREMQHIISIMDIISNYCPNLKTGKYYKNVFAEEDKRYTIDKKANEYCVFSYFDKSGDLKCAVHSAALEIHKDPYYYKPFVCSVWPVTFFKDMSKRTFIDLDTESHVPCIKKKEMKEKTIDRELLNIITIIMGKDIVSLRNFFKQHNVLPSIVSTLVVHFLH